MTVAANPCLLLSRRRFLAARGALSLLPSSALALVHETPAAQPASSLFLFFDWYHVKKGDLTPVLDAAQVSEEGRQMRERFASEFNRVFDYGEHGFRRVDIPYGVRITPEPAVTSKPWLVPDRP